MSQIADFIQAIGAIRRPSAFKPIVYLAALESGYRPSSTLADEPISIGDWQPQDADRRFRGSVSLEDALVNSLNLPTVRLSEAVGRGRIVALSHQLGIGTALNAEHPSLGLGSEAVTLYDLTQVYATIAAGGRRIEPKILVGALDVGGHLVYWPARGKESQVVSRQSAETMKRMLVRVVDEGTGRAARLRGIEAGGKTGTTQNNCDAWFVGFAGDLVTGIWVGNDNSSPMNAVTGGSVPATAWRAFEGGQAPIRSR